MKKPVINEIVAATRYVMIFAVLTIFLGSTILLILGVFEMIQGILEVFGHHIEGEDFKIILVKSVDTILVATVLYVIAIGLYQLFINSSVSLPEWLHTSSVGDLERRLAGLVITILSVFFLTAVYEGMGGIELLSVGLAIAAIIFSISFFLRKHKE